MNDAILDIRNVTKKFGGLKAVNDVSFRVAQGELLGIAGPNGSGKSSLFNLISGVPFGPTSGEVWYDGHRIDRRPAHLIARGGVSRTFQKDAEFPELSAFQTVVISGVYGRQLSDRAARVAAGSALDQVLFPEGRREMQSSGLSVYEKKQLMIASALVMGPKVLMLDEPASGLTKPEISALDALLVSINKAGLTILLIEHVLGLLLSVATRLIVLNEGRLLAEGDPVTIMKRPDVIEAYLGTRAA